jgi:endoglucanase
MKIELGLVLLACAIAASNLERSVHAEDFSRAPKLGAYDPHQALVRQRDVSVDHVFVDLSKFSPATILETVEQAAERGREVLLTVEPWTRAADGRQGGETLLQDVLNGGFDTETDQLCGAIGASRVPVTLSWGHEMDETEGRFPWADRSAELYKAAFRHFVDRCRPLADKARIAWTPKGEAGMERFYPGTSYVDVIGLTLFDSQRWNEDNGDTRSLTTKFTGLRDRVRAFGKPIILAEFGVEGDQAYREKALSCFRRDLHAFSDVEAVVYFNDRETWAWPEPYGRPDWRISNARWFICDRPPEGS